MDTDRTTDRNRANRRPPSRLPESLANAMRFWEPRRVSYNLLLTAVGVAWLAGTWPHFRPALTPFHSVQVAVLALLANICYCAAYLLDFAVQSSVSHTQALFPRKVIWVLGTVLAIVLENYWIADEIYPYVR